MFKRIMKWFRVAPTSVTLHVEGWRAPTTSTRGADCEQLAARGFPPGSVRVSAQFDELARLTAAQVRAEYARLWPLAYKQDGSVRNAIAFGRMEQARLVLHAREAYGDGVQLVVVTHAAPADRTTTAALPTQVMPEQHALAAPLDVVRLVRCT